MKAFILTSISDNNYLANVRAGIQSAGTNDPVNAGHLLVNIDDWLFGAKHSSLSGWMAPI